MLPVYAWHHPSGYTNFGDELNGPLLSAILGRPVEVTRDGNRGPKLLAVGSVLTDWAARPGDTVWGSGSWGNEIPRGLDVRAVRGPLTADHLAQAGYARLSVFGDPALLLPRYFPFAVGGLGVGYVPHHGDPPIAFPRIIDVRRPPLEVAAAIAASDLIVSGSLHGLIVAEAYGVPAVLADGNEVRGNRFKFIDYYASTGRPALPEPVPVCRAYEHNATRPAMPNLDDLLRALPTDQMAL